MTKAQYELFEALNPFFKVVMKGLRGLVDGKHFFDMFAEDAIFESRYDFPAWPTMISGRANRGTASSNPSNDVANYKVPEGRDGR